MAHRQDEDRDGESDGNPEAPGHVDQSRIRFFLCRYGRGSSAMPQMGQYARRVTDDLRVHRADELDRRSGAATSSGSSGIPHFGHAQDRLPTSGCMGHV